MSSIFGIVTVVEFDLLIIIGFTASRLLMTHMCTLVLAVELLLYINVLTRWEYNIAYVNGY